jgi:predicted transcriptional regulator
MPIGDYAFRSYIAELRCPHSKPEHEVEITEKFVVLDCTASIVAAYVTNNTIQKENLPALIADTFYSLSQINRPAAVVQELKPAVPIKRSVQPDHIVCLEDGKTFKSLKRHLKNQYSMTPKEYREKWGLPADYPMVAPNYARARSELAKKMGLGRRAMPVAIAQPPQAPVKSAKKAPAKKKATAKSA